MNQSLDFFHQIPIKVFHDKDTVAVQVKVNHTVVFSETFAPGVEHQRTVAFRYNYNDGEKNTLEFEFSGSVESSNRYLIIGGVGINNTTVDVYEAHYTPQLNQQWWQNLTAKKQESYLDSIHGKNGNKFGWFGTIKYYYYCGVDLKSRYNTSATKSELLLGRAPSWVFLDEKANTLSPVKVKRYGKLL